MHRNMREETPNNSWTIIIRKQRKEKNLPEERNINRKSNNRPITNPMLHTVTREKTNNSQDIANPRPNVTTP